MTLRLVLMRHGQTHSNLQRVIDTRPPGADLTEKGQQQALSAGAELAEMCGPRISEAYCSCCAHAADSGTCGGGVRGDSGVATG